MLLPAALPPVRTGPRASARLAAAPASSGLGPGRAARTAVGMGGREPAFTTLEQTPPAATATSRPWQWAARWRKGRWAHGSQYSRRSSLEAKRPLGLETLGAGGAWRSLQDTTEANPAIPRTRPGPGHPAILASCQAAADTGGQGGLPTAVGGPGGVGRGLVSPAETRGRGGAALPARTASAPGDGGRGGAAGRPGGGLELLHEPSAPDAVCSAAGGAPADRLGRDGSGL